MPHKVFQMVPLDVVREVPNIDAAVLLGILPQVVDHLVLCLVSFLEGA